MFELKEIKSNERRGRSPDEDPSMMRIAFDNATQRARNWMRAHIRKTSDSLDKTSSLSTMFYNLQQDVAGGGGASIAASCKALYHIARVHLKLV